MGAMPTALRGHAEILPETWPLRAVAMAPKDSWLSALKFSPSPYLPLSPSCIIIGQPPITLQTPG